MKKFNSDQNLSEENAEPESIKRLNVFSPEKLKQFSSQFQTCNSEKISGERLRKEVRNILLPLLISAICIGNIVLLFMAVYYGNDDILFDREGRAKIILSAPVFIYSIIPFYKRVFSSIGSKQSRIDVINSFITGVGFVLSIYNYHIGYEDVYITSITIFIFLHLTGRYFLESSKGRYLINLTRDPKHLVSRYLFHSHTLYRYLL